MKKIIPFKKDIIFKTNLAEVTSISLEHSLHTESNTLITGEFIVSGEYKMTDTSVNTESFNYNLPFDINLDDHYILDDIKVDIDDFYYEIINENILSVNIDVLIDKLVEKPLIPKEEPKIEIEEESEIKVGELERCIEKEDTMEFENEIIDIEAEREQTENLFKEIDSEVKLEIEEEQTEAVKSLFDNFKDDTETYATYKICIVREGDTLELIMQKYGTNKEELQKYNDLSEIKIGDKLIIPTSVTNF